MGNSLEDIFNSDELGLLDIKPKISKVKSDEDRLIESFGEISAFVEKYDREPSRDSITEYGLLSRLNAFRNNEKHKEILKPYDRFNLLGEVELSPEQTMDELMEDDPLGLLDNDADRDNSLFEYSRVPKEPVSRASSDLVAKREPMSEEEFEQYEVLFQQVHRELKEGKRRLLPFRNVEGNVKVGHYYLADGLLCYLKESNTQKVSIESSSGSKVRKDGRTVTIFENGTYSKMLFQSLRRLLSTNGKIVTEVEDAPSSLFGNSNVVAEDVMSGWIYVLRSKHPKLAHIENLFKIGFSSHRVEDRIRSASTEATFLYADVEVVAT